MPARTKAEPAEPEAVELHYIGAGDYVIGISTDPEVTTVVDAVRADSLLETGLFATGPAPVAGAPTTPKE